MSGRDERVAWMRQLGVSGLAVSGPVTPISQAPISQASASEAMSSEINASSVDQGSMSSVPLMAPAPNMSVAPPAPPVASRQPDGPPANASQGPGSPAPNASYAAPPQNMSSGPHAPSSPGPASSEPVYLVRFNGQDYCGTRAELTALQRTLVTAANRVAIGPLQQRLGSHRERYHSLRDLANDQFMVAFALAVVTLGAARLGGVEQALAAEAAAIEALRSGIARNAAEGAQLYRAAVDAGQATARAIDDYLDAVDIGGSRAVEALTVTEITCFAIAAACGAALLAPAGASVMATAGANAASGAGFGALQTLAEQEGAVHFGGSNASAGDIALAVGQSALLNGVGSFLGSRMGTALKGSVAASLATRLRITDPVVIELLRVRVEGAIGGAVNTVVTNFGSVAAGQMTMERFTVLVVENMIAGGIASQLTTSHGAPAASSP